MRKKLLTGSSWFVFLFVSITVSAQQLPPDTSASNLAMESGVNTYLGQMAENSPLYNGYEFVPYGLNITGFPWFGSPEMKKGAVYYDGSLFKGIDLYYDLINDQVIIKDFTRNYFITLVGDKIRYFDLGNDHFIRFSEGNEVGLEKGFYHSVYEGNTTVLIRYMKKIQYTTNPEKTSSRYTQYTSYYVINKGIYSQISSKGDLIDVYSDKKNEIRKFIGENKLNFRKDPANTLIKVAKHYDQLKSP